MIAGMGPFSEKDLEIGWEPCRNREVLPDICVCCGAYAPGGAIICPRCGQEGRQNKIRFVVTGREENG